MTEPYEIMTPRDAIRMRPGMYVGERGIQGVLNVVGNAIVGAFRVLDHTTGGLRTNEWFYYDLAGDQISLELIWSGNKVPFDTDLSELVDPTHFCGSGMCLLIANALSSEFEIKSNVAGRTIVTRCCEGEIVHQSVGGVCDSEFSLHIQLTPDRQILGPSDFSDEHLAGYIVGAAGQHSCWASRKGE